MRVRRTQPPVGYRYLTGDLARGIRDAARVRDFRETVLEPDMARSFGVRRAFAVSSGKAALTLILRALHALSRRRKVIIPAYTCYSLPSSVVKAGLEVVPCDLAAGSFDYDYEQLATLLGPDVLCAVSVHLFGLPSDTARLAALCRRRGIFVVDDAAQAMDVSEGDVPLGTRGDAGFFSFGRGKAITCGSGGVVLTNSTAIAGALSKQVGALPPATRLAAAQTVLTLFSLSLFISPWLYWLPAGVPWLKLGETIFHEDFSITPLSNVQAALLRNWRSTLESLNATRRANARFYVEHIAGGSEFECARPCLRFPIVLEDEAQRERLLVGESGRSLGISRMYPATVAAIPQLRGLSTRRFPVAEKLARTLVTLPTHPLLSEKDRDSICSLVNRCRNRPAPSVSVRLAS